ncbi:hypothetical protein OH768_33335 [Streptomyces sp. NBC_01622]|nr:hypothetical protein OH768_33335 [Streptomyces sp. NBC_01622]
MKGLFIGVPSPSTPGSFLRSFTHGHLKQLHAAKPKEQHTARLTVRTSCA